MRSVLLAALVGSIFYVNPGAAQDTSDQSGTASHKKHTSTAIDALFENGPERPHALAEAQREEAGRKKEQGTTAKEAAPIKPHATAPAPIVPTVQAVPPGPPQKNLTGTEFSLIHVGSNTKQVLSVLGPPSSRVEIPGDDDHLHEILQYWVKGVPAATIRLDNGRVVKIETTQK